jgi:hypothetical protein
MTRPPRVCLFVEFMYPVVSGGRIPFAGGIEVQLALMGRGLAERGFDVRVVTCDYGQPDRLRVGGLTLHRAYPPAGGVPGLRFIHPRLTLGLSALWGTDADVYLFRGAALWAGLVYAVARVRKRRFVWLTAHVDDVRREMPRVHGLRDREALRRAIRGADAIVTQTRVQQERLRADWGLESTVIMNSVELPPEATLGDAGAGTTVLWLSTYKPDKRPEWFVRFAERHPDVRCRMVGVVPGTSQGGRCFEAAKYAAGRNSNLRVTGPIPHERVGEVFQSTAVFAHTSPEEGFPNTLLESWARAIPTVSCFDPDGIVERERLGACRARYEDWERELEIRLADTDLRRREGRRARQWTLWHHAPEVIHDQLAALLRPLISD